MLTKACRRCGLEKDAKRGYYASNRRVCKLCHIAEVKIRHQFTYKSKKGKEKDPDMVTAMMMELVATQKYVTNATLKRLKETNNELVSANKQKIPPVMGYVGGQVLDDETCAMLESRLFDLLINRSMSKARHKLQLGLKNTKILDINHTKHTITLKMSKRSDAYKKLNSAMQTLRDEFQADVIPACIEDNIDHIVLTCHWQKEFPACLLSNYKEIDPADAMHGFLDNPESVNVAGHLFIACYTKKTFRFIATHIISTSASDNS